MIKVYSAVEAGQLAIAWYANLQLHFSTHQSLLVRLWACTPAGNEPEVIKATWNLPVPASQQKDIKHEQTPSADDAPAAAAEDESQADSSRQASQTSSCHLPDSLQWRNCFTFGAVPGIPADSWKPAFAS